MSIRENDLRQRQQGLETLLQVVEADKKNMLEEREKMKNVFEEELRRREEVRRAAEQEASRCTVAQRSF